ncbi:MAG: hypothetical protein D6726_08995 [Nitrospirae bacterium]|nr:MAG: hypothetical protein D6726_08995 [Nitrospirota bacterium]
MLKKKIEIALYDNAGRLLSSGILRYRGKAADEQCVFSLNNRNGDAMRVSRAFWILLSSHPSRFSEKRVFRIRSVDDIESITLNYEDTRYDIRKTGSTWVMKEKQYRQVDVYPLLEYVMKLSYEKIFFQKEYQFDKPFFDLSVKVNGEEQRLRVGRVDVEKEVTTTFMFVPVRPGSPEKRRVRYWLSESSATPYKGVINSEQIRAIVEGVRRYE